MYLTEIEPDEIKTQIKSLNSKRASDIFGISANFLKIAGDKIIQPLAFSLKDSKMKVNSYHPNSILPMINI